jgi:hypothetical protein
MNTLRDKAKIAWDKQQEKAALQNAERIAKTNILLFDKLDYWKTTLQTDDIVIDQTTGEYVIEDHIRCCIDERYMHIDYMPLKDVRIHDFKSHIHITELAHLYIAYQTYDKHRLMGELKTTLKNQRRKQNTYKFAMDIPNEINSDLVISYVDFLKKQIK